MACARCGREADALPDAELYGADGYKTSDVNMATWGNQSDIEFIYDLEWEQDHLPRSTHIGKEGSNAVVTMLQPYFTLVRLKGGVQPSFPTYIENARELLDAPGEWYFDRTAQVVYYIPRAGEDVNSAEIMAPVVEKLLELRGSLDAPVHNIQFEGITFCHASWLRPSQIGLIDIQANFVISPQNLIARNDGGVDTSPQRVTARVPPTSSCMPRSRFASSAAPSPNSGVAESTWSTARKTTSFRAVSFMTSRVPLSRLATWLIIIRATPAKS